MDNTKERDPFIVSVGTVDGLEVCYIPLRRTYFEMGVMIDDGTRRRWIDLADARRMADLLNEAADLSEAGARDAGYSEQT